MFDSLSWTEAQRKNVSQYEPGQRLRFVRTTKHFERGDTVEVVATVENGLRIRRADGTEADFVPAGSAAFFDVGEARELKVSPGDWLLLQANHGKEFINGEHAKSGRSKTGALPWLMVVRSRMGSTLSLTDTPLPATVRKARPWMKCCWSPHPGLSER